MKFFQEKVNLFNKMNLFEIILFSITAACLGILVGYSLSTILTNSIFVCWSISVVGCAYFISYFFVTDKQLRQKNNSKKRK
ncbi:MAG: hypothetical protein Q4G02_03145 [bacterium]|nr:hypothetical protein [bacterium]